MSSSTDRPRSVLGAVITSPRPRHDRGGPASATRPASPARKRRSAAPRQGQRQAPATSPRAGRRAAPARRARHRHQCSAGQAESGNGGRQRTDPPDRPRAAQSWSPVSAPAAEAARSASSAAPSAQAPRGGSARSAERNTPATSSANQSSISGLISVSRGNSARNCSYTLS